MSTPNLPTKKESLKKEAHKIKSSAALSDVLTDDLSGDIAVANRGKIHSLQFQKSRPVTPEIKITIDESKDRPSQTENLQEKPPLIAENFDKRSLLSYPKSVSLSVSPSVQVNNYPNQSIWRHPRVRKNPKTIAAALGLFLIGSAFIIAAITMIILERNGSERAAIFVVMGLLTGLPGGYQSFYIYQALKGAPGYHFQSIPSFDL